MLPSRLSHHASWWTWPRCWACAPKGSCLTPSLHPSSVTRVWTKDSQACSLVLSFVPMDEPVLWTGLQWFELWVNIHVVSILDWVSLPRSWGGPRGGSYGLTGPGGFQRVLQEGHSQALPGPSTCQTRSLPQSVGCTFLSKLLHFSLLQWRPLCLWPQETSRPLEGQLGSPPSPDPVAQPLGPQHPGTGGTTGAGSWEVKMKEVEPHMGRARAPDTGRQPKLEDTPFPLQGHRPAHLPHPRSHCSTPRVAPTPVVPPGQAEAVCFVLSWLRFQRPFIS